MSSAQPEISPIGSVPDTARTEQVRAREAGDNTSPSTMAEAAVRWQDRIYNTLRKLTGNEQDAADLTQETFVRAMSSAGSFRNESSAYTWLFRIAVNLASTRARQVRRRRTTVAGQMQRGDEPDVMDRQRSRTMGPEEAAQRHESSEQVIAALGRVNEEQRQLLVLRDIEGMEYEKIAEVLGVPLGTLKSRLFRARLALREELSGYFGDSESAA